MIHPVARSAALIIFPRREWRAAVRRRLTRRESLICVKGCELFDNTEDGGWDEPDRVANRWYRMIFSNIKKDKTDTIIHQHFCVTEKDRIRRTNTTSSHPPTTPHPAPAPDSTPTEPSTPAQASF